MMTGGDYEFQIGNHVMRNQPGRGQEALEQIPKLLHQALRQCVILVIRWWCDGYDGDGVLDGGDNTIEGNGGDGGDVDVDHVDVENGEDVDDGNGDDGDGNQNNLSLLPLVEGALVQPLPPVANINSFPSCHLK